MPWPNYSAKIPFPYPYTVRARAVTEQTMTGFLLYCGCKSPDGDRLYLYLPCTYDCSWTHIFNTCTWACTVPVSEHAFGRLCLRMCLCLCLHAPMPKCASGCAYAYNMCLISTVQTSSWSRGRFWEMVSGHCKRCRKQEGLFFIIVFEVSLMKNCWDLVSYRYRAAILKVPKYSASYYWKKIKKIKVMQCFSLHTLCMHCWEVMEAHRIRLNRHAWLYV